MCPCGPLQRQSFSPPTAFRCLQRFGAGAGCGRGIRRWLERVRPPAPATACNASPDSAAVYVRRRRPGGTGGGGSGAAGGSRSCCQHDPGGYDARGAWIWPSQLRRWAGGKKSVGVRGVLRCANAAGNAVPVTPAQRTRNPLSRSQPDRQSLAVPQHVPPVLVLP